MVERIYVFGGTARSDLTVLFVHGHALWDMFSIEFDLPIASERVTGSLRRRATWTSCRSPSQIWCWLSAWNDEHHKLGTSYKKPWEKAWDPGSVTDFVLGHMACARLLSSDFTWPQECSSSFAESRGRHHQVLQGLGSRTFCCSNLSSLAVLIKIHRVLNMIRYHEAYYDLCHVRYRLQIVGRIFMRAKLDFSDIERGSRRPKNITRHDSCPKSCRTPECCASKAT